MQLSALYLPDQLNVHLQGVWAYLLSQYSSQTISLTGTYLLQLVSFVLPCLTLDLLLPALAPKFSLRHKTQGPQRQPSAAQVRHCISVVIRNNLIVLIPYTIATIYMPPGEGLYRMSPTLPPFFEFTRELFLCIFAREVLFYYTHRGLHYSKIYQYIHETHHLFPCPVTWASQYAHPVEHLLANTMPVMLPPILLKSHQVTAWAFAGIATLEAVFDHSGYDFFGKTARAHDRHHERSRGDYGTLGILDWWHGTASEGKL